MWKDLTLKEKAEIMKMSVANGVTDINDIQELYDNSIGHKFDDAGRIVTLADLPIEYVKKYGHLNVVTPKGVRMPLSQAYRDYNQTSINVNDVPGITDYLVTQDQPDISEQAHIDKVAADRKVREVNSTLDIARHLLPSELQYLASRAIMESGRTFAEPTFGDIEVERASGAINEPDESAAQATYLLPRDEQKKKFLEFGYIEGKKGDYGLVKNAVGNRDIPVYQTLKDAVDRKDLSVLFNNYELKKVIDEHTQYLFPIGPPLLHAGSYPTAYYVDKDGKVYTKSWDLNDYGDDKNRIKGGTGSHYKGIRRFLANTLDKVGSPTVITTGFQPLMDPSINGSGSQLRLDDLMNYLNKDDVKYIENRVGAHWYPRETILEDGNLGFIDGSFGGPEIVITNKKALGGHLYKGGGNKQQLGIIDSILTKHGVNYTKTSGYRGPNSKVGKLGSKSAHARTLSDGSSAAIDIVPSPGSSWDKLYAQMSSPEVRADLAKYGLDILDETSASTMKKTGATGKHFHVGKGIKGQQGKGIFVNQNNPTISAYHKMYGKPDLSISNDILYNPAQELKWTNITPTIQQTPWMDYLSNISQQPAVSFNTPIGISKAKSSNVFNKPMSFSIPSFENTTRPEVMENVAQLPQYQSILNSNLFTDPYLLFRNS